MPAGGMSHDRLLRVRSDHRRKATSMLARSAGRVVVETLILAGLMRSYRLARVEPIRPDSWPSWSSGVTGKEPSV